MNLGELKKSLTRFPEDMNEVEVLFTFVANEDKEEYDTLGFVSYAEVKDTTCIILGSTKAAMVRLKKGTLRYADGSKPTDLE